MQRQEDCVFCKIVHGQAPCFKVHEDDLTISFLDIFPVADGHTLVVTKEHFADIFEASAEALRAVAANAQRVACAIKKRFKRDGLAIFQLNGAAAGQSVFHYHIHLIPRSAGDELKIHAREKGSEERLRTHAEALAAILHTQ